VDVLTYVDRQVSHAAAAYTTFLMTDPNARAAAQGYKAVKEWIGPQGLTAMQMGLKMAGPDLTHGLSDSLHLHPESTDMLKKAVELVPEQVEIAANLAVPDKERELAAQREEQVREQQRQRELETQREAQWQENARIEQQQREQAQREVEQQVKDLFELGLSQALEQRQTEERDKAEQERQERERREQQEQADRDRQEAEQRAAQERLDQERDAAAQKELQEAQAALVKDAEIHAAREEAAHQEAVRQEAERLAEERRRAIEEAREAAERALAAQRARFDGPEGPTR
jgi:hypothetical protein